MSNTPWYTEGGFPPGAQPAPPAAPAAPYPAAPPAPPPPEARPWDVSPDLDRVRGIFPGPSRAATSQDFVNRLNQLHYEASQGQDPVIGLLLTHSIMQDAALAILDQSRRAAMFSNALDQQIIRRLDVVASGLQTSVPLLQQLAQGQQQLIQQQAQTNQLLDSLVRMLMMVSGEGSSGAGGRATQGASRTPALPDPTDPAAQRPRVKRGPRRETPTPQGG